MCRPPLRATKPRANARVRTNGVRNKLATSARTNAAKKLFKPQTLSLGFGCRLATKHSRAGGTLGVSRCYVEIGDSPRRKRPAGQLETSPTLACSDGTAIDKNKLFSGV